jgi:hypothetical protein
MDELVLVLFKSREADMGKLSRKGIRKLNAMKLDNVVRGKHTAKQWNKYIDA